MKIFKSVKISSSVEKYFQDARLTFLFLFYFLCAKPALANLRDITNIYG